jgi:hypothetical protein
MIRHGQSKWNRAMSRINITGLLDRDHALTTEGIKQAIELNSRWRQELIQDTNFNTLHADSSTSFVPDMFDFSRMDDDESLDLDEEDSDEGGSDSDNENPSNAVSPMATQNAPLSGGLNKIYNSFVMRRGSVSFGGQEWTSSSQPGSALPPGHGRNRNDSNASTPRTSVRIGSKATSPESKKLFLLFHFVRFLFRAYFFPSGSILQIKKTEPLMR